MMGRFLFVGEKPSNKADSMDAVWADGALAAKQLFDALHVNNIDPRTCVFINLFGDSADAAENDRTTIEQSVLIIQSLARTNRLEIVAMGNKVAKHLRRHAIGHRAIAHPAALGAIRKKSAYAAHIAERLTA